jgi:hypothetical protein
MANYEIKKVNKNWAVYKNGGFLTWFSMKKWAKKCVEINRIKDSGEMWNPHHPRWAELTTE